MLSGFPQASVDIGHPHSLFLAVGKRSGDWQAVAERDPRDSLFLQAAVVAEAYDFTPDWSEVLYQQVILKGDFNYLEEHKQHGLLRTGTFEEIAHK